jgi:hypothetical protein
MVTSMFKLCAAAGAPSPDVEYLGICGVLFRGTQATLVLSPRAILRNVVASCR